MHPNEPMLVFRAESGAILPTSAHAQFAKDAAPLGRAYTLALAEQVRRQSALTLAEG